MSRVSKLMFSGFFLAAAFLPQLASASTFVPEPPIQFERVNLRTQVDSCVFNASTVNVTKVGDVIQVRHQANACLVPGPPAVVDIQLGAYPQGTYRVEVYDSPLPSASPVERLELIVLGTAETLQFPGSPRPLTDYSGHWWAPAQSGWGLTLNQGAQHALVGVLAVYGPDHTPEWFTLHPDRWLSSTRWTGTIVRTTGPAWSAPNYDTGIVESAVVGTVTLDFGMAPGNVGKAKLTYTIGTSTVSVDIARIRFY